MDELTGVFGDDEAVLTEEVVVLAEEDGFTENMVAGSVLYIPGEERVAEPELIFAVLRVDICI